jgi:hypothetical protein
MSDKDDLIALEQSRCAAFAAGDVTALDAIAAGRLLACLWRRGFPVAKLRGLTTSAKSRGSRKGLNCLSGELCPKVGDGVIRRRFEVA